MTSAVLFTPASTAYAHGHSGGCHSGTSYYYCGGHAAHTHTGGVCPYASTVSKTTVKKVQKVLKSCGYNCGTADGVMGTKTVKALKKYQKANGLTVDGIIGSSTLRSMGLL